MQTFFAPPVAWPQAFLLDLESLAACSGFVDQGLVSFASSLAGGLFT